MIIDTNFMLAYLEEVKTAYPNANTTITITITWF